MRQIHLALLLLVLVLPVEAAAQGLDSPGNQPFCKWDASGGLSLRFGEREDVAVPPAGWTAEAGRYWTPHIKTSLAVMTTRQSGYRDYSYQPPAPTSSYTESVTTPTGYGASVAYQFFENQFVHPYVSVGARVASAYSTTTTYSVRAPYQSVITSTGTRVEVRPVLGGGFKSYFGNGRAFMRSELLTSIDPHGSPHAILTIGAGVDF
jgi:hypothetical protein